MRFVQLCAFREAAQYAKDDLDHQDAASKTQYANRLLLLLPVILFSLT